jgi:hypothetical protein
MAQQASIGNFQDRTIYDFKNRLIGGGARSNLFECELTFPTAVFDTGSIDKDAASRDSRFLIKSAALPASNLTTIAVPFRGRTLKIAGDRTFDTWQITVLNDTNFRLRNIFEKWSNFINRHDDNSGVITPASYQREIVVHQLSRGVDTLASGKTPITDRAPSTNSSIPILKSYKLYGCYPSAVDAIPLSYESTDTIEEFGVTFEVQWWDAFDASGNKLFDTSEPNGVGPTIGAAGAALQGAAVSVANL